MISAQADKDDAPQRSGPRPRTPGCFGADHPHGTQRCQAAEAGPPADPGKHVNTKTPP